MTAQVLDYSAGRPGAAAIKAAGYQGAMRYIGQPGATKNTTPLELQDFDAHGLGMGLVFEQRAGNWRGAFARGQIDGSKARQHATSIGFPKDRPIYMAVDQDVVTGAEFGLMLDYLRGANGPLGGSHLTGVYGEHDVCLRAQQAGVARWFWQCRAWSGSPAKLFGGRHLYQNARQVVVGGFQCDLNDVLQADWGQHNVTSIEEADMPLSEDDLNQVRGVFRDELRRALAFLTTGAGNQLTGGQDWVAQATTLNEVPKATAAEVKVTVEAPDGVDIEASVRRALASARQVGQFEFAPDT